MESISGPAKCVVVIIAALGSVIVRFSTLRSSGLHPIVILAVLQERKRAFDSKVFPNGLPCRLDCREHGPASPRKKGTHRKTATFSRGTGASLVEAGFVFPDCPRSCLPSSPWPAREIATCESPALLGLHGYVQTGGTAR